MPSERALLRVLDIMTAPRSAVPELVRKVRLRPELERLGEKDARTAVSEAASALRQRMESKYVIGAGIAEKITRGKGTGKDVVIVYVSKKVPSRRLAEAEAFEKTADPDLTGGDLVEFDIQELVPPVPEVNKIEKPIQPGYSIGHVSVSAGTLGAVVSRGRSYQVLSNSHVLADSGRGKKGDKILYPGRHDGGKQPKHVAATLSAQVPFKKGGAFVNDVDAAVAAPLKARLVDLRSEIKGIGVPRKERTAKRGMKVVKVGRTTDKTTGTVRDMHFRIKINYGAGVGEVGFRDQVLCTRYTKPGDSGSLVLDAKSKGAVGLHFAGADGAGTKGSSVFNPIDKVLKALRVSLVITPIKPTKPGGGKQGRPPKARRRKE